MFSYKKLNSSQSLRLVRVATLLVAAAAIAVIGSSSCTQRTTEVANANSSVNVNSNNASQTNKPSGATSTLKELPASAMNTEIKTLDGKTLRLSDYKGKVVVLDLWATWCPPCRQEIPHLIELSEQYADRGVEVIGLTIEKPETETDTVRAFKDEFKINYPIGFADDDFTASVARPSRSGGINIPQTLVITRDGHVLTYFTGYDQTVPPKLRQAIEQAISIS